MVLVSLVIGRRVFSRRSVLPEAVPNSDESGVGEDMVPSALCCPRSVLLDCCAAWHTNNSALTRDASPLVTDSSTILLIQP